MVRPEPLLTIGLFALLSACMPQKNLHPDIQGHRGCRGLLPENSIPAFLKATALGCDFLELDVVISGDGQVVISHEPWMHHTICLEPNGDPIPVERERSLNIFRMTVPEIQAYDCGSLEHPRFPDQDQRKAYKPTLHEMVEAVDEHALLSGVAPPSFNVEIKSDPAFYGTFQPEPEVFAKLVLAAIDSLGIMDRCIIQSFDTAILEAVHAEREDAVVALLVENDLGIEGNLSRLSFKPDIYSPQFSMANEAMLKTLRAKNIELAVWTVNAPGDIKRMLDLGVDAIITDRPDLAIKLLEAR
ncbi:MAG: glycerophosphodiester phosphodiesterase [Flavobacteriales bacterium]|nr:glycerophosphodiester phosphodiesterase [Flavobacteriales bacterium]